MTYAKRLLTAKLLITGCVVFYSLAPLFLDFGPSYMGDVNSAVRGPFHMSWTLMSNVIALPVLLFALWSKLHGSGRSVRLVAFLGLAYTLGFFAAAALTPYVDILYAVDPGPGHKHGWLGRAGNMKVNAVITLLLIAGIILSIRRS